MATPGTETTAGEESAPLPSPHHCPACASDLDGFLPGPGGRPDARCPRCDALERHRFVALLVRRLSPRLARARYVLDIAPMRQVREIVQTRFDALYVGMDIHRDRPVAVVGDARRIPLRDATFDLVVCSHVLEHVDDDAAVIREMARVLDDDGRALVQVPVRRRGPTDEDPDAPAEERVRRFGQEDHVRTYGDDLPDRLAAGGLHPTRVVPRDLLDAEELRRFGIVAEEEVFICAPGTAPIIIVDGWRSLDRRPVTPLLDPAVPLPSVEAAWSASEVRHWRVRYERLASHPVVAVLLAVRRVGLRLRRMLARIRGRG